MFVLLLPACLSGHSEPSEISLGHETQSACDGSDGCSASVRKCYGSCWQNTDTNAHNTSNTGAVRKHNRLLASLHRQARALQAKNIRLQRNKLNVLARNEFFNSAMEEVRAEINIPRATLSAPKLLGMIEQLNTAGSPSFFFHTRCSLSSDEVRNRWCSGAEEADESVVSKSRLHFLLLQC